MLLFAGIFFLIGTLDEFAVDIAYLWLRITRRIGTGRIDAAELSANPLGGRVAVFIPCWQESRVIGATVTHALTVWPDPELTIHIGCYVNDAETLAAARSLARRAGLPRARCRQSRAGADIQSGLSELSLQGA